MLNACTVVQYISPLKSGNHNETPNFFLSINISRENLLRTEVSNVLSK